MQVCYDIGPRWSRRNFVTSYKSSIYDTDVSTNINTDISTNINTDISTNVRTSTNGKTRDSATIAA
jgi:hypothetical protein